MAEARASISLLRFCAGSMYFGIAAEDVAAVAPAQGSAVHIGALLGLEPKQDARRMIYLAPQPDQKIPGAISFQADVPVDVVRCNADDILPMPSAMLPSAIARDRWQPVMGFARIAHEIILLLDLSSVIAKLVDNAQEGTP